VEGDGRDTSVVIPPVQLADEQDVGELAVAVGPARRVTLLAVCTTAAELSISVGSSRWVSRKGASWFTWNVIS